ncbi:sensor histidine kinase [Actibacterium sp. 188UL27-1]|uniref:sensor histidine kinase n=1 Tax=Actibacterium sp. 188UL27-1 TaxID=2786961 RepID=UPI00195C76A8|nr:sensor histidine kinase [Actibacterium sp. 188UL27-1]MBM7066531.1 MASE1 domain-containing protein [Actibacterium sp. 188UL27-1]
MKRPLRIGLICTIVLAFSIASHAFNAVTAQMPVIWLPNALIIAGLVLTKRRYIPDLVLSHAIGVLLGHLLWGLSPLFSIGLMLVNAAEVALIAILMRRVLGMEWPHRTERTYLRFVGLAALPVVAVTSVAAGLLIHGMAGVEFWAAYDSWIVGSSLSTIGFVPLFLLLLREGLPLHTRVQMWEVIVAVCVVASTFLLLSGGVIPGSAIKTFHLVLPLLAITALAMGQTGTIVTTACLAPVIALVSSLSGNVIYDAELVHEGQRAIALGVFWCSAVIPSNLISAMVDRLRMGEQTQRDISAMKSKFMSSMSHEIRTPMNAIHGMFELFHRASQVDRHKLWAQAGLSASRNLQSQVTQLLQMARLDEYAMQATETEVNLAETLAMWKTTTQATLMVEGKTIDVATTMSDTAPAAVVMDLSRVHQIMINFLSNAVKFSTDGTIDIGADMVKGDLHLSVTDQGAGLTEKDKRMVFSRYWRAEGQGSAGAGGTGLGLSICRDLADQLGGQILIKSDYGRGSTFTLSMPLSKL